MGLVRDNILAMTGYVPGEQPLDTQVIKLNTNENPFPPSPRAMEAIAGVTPEQLRRYPSPDAMAFRQAAARVHGISPDMILATNGGDELLAMVFRACVGEGQNVAWLDPSYSLYPVLARMQAARQIVLPYNISGTRWELPDAIFGLDAKLLLIVNPNAPSGTFIDMDTLSRIISGFSGLVLVDEAYVNFAPHSALQLVGKFPNLVLLRSMSKGYGLAGLRFGYAIGQPDILQQLHKVRDSYPCDALAIAAATAAIEDQAYARGTWERVKTERQWLTSQLAAIGYTMPESHANFVLARVPVGTDARGIYEQLKARNILVRYFALPRLTDKLRITIGSPDQNRALVAALQPMPAPPATNH